MTRWVAPLLVLLAAAASAGAEVESAAGPSAAPGREPGREPGAELGGDFQLTDHRGQPFDSRQLRGRVALIFFGYTACPDVCPTELLRLRGVLEQLGERSARVQPLFVSVDPQRDSPEQLARYVNWFDPRIIGLTGSEAELRAVTARFNASFRLNAESESSYTVDHSANLFVLDPAGELATIVPYGLPPEHIVAVVRALLD